MAILKATISERGVFFTINYDHNELIVQLINK